MKAIRPLRRKIYKIQGVYNMKYNWIDDFLLSKKGVTKDFQEDWN